jgi:hypothetical protein
MNNIICLRVFMCCLALFVFQSTSLANETAPQLAHQLARQVVDQLMNIENKKAATTIQQLERSYPKYPLLGFMKVAPLWAKAESTYDKRIRLTTLLTVLGMLSKNIQFLQSQVEKYPDNPDWKLSLGLSQAFSGLAYMRLGEWLKAYHAGRAGRDTLRALVKSHPNIEDAYFVLGFYEYYTGNVPFYLAWMTWLVDLSGNRELGLQYIHRAIQYAPVFSPEASRLLLAQTATNQANACQRKEHAHKMVTRYPNNEQFPWLEKQFNSICLSGMANTK